MELWVACRGDEKYWGHGGEKGTGICFVLGTGIVSELRFCCRDFWVFLVSLYLHRQHIVVLSLAPIDVGTFVSNHVKFMCFLALMRG